MNKLKFIYKGKTVQTTGALVFLKDTVKKERDWETKEILEHLVYSFCSPENSLSLKPFYDLDIPYPPSLSY